jgi:hypothetical protein
VTILQFLPHFSAKRSAETMQFVKKRAMIAAAIATTASSQSFILADSKTWVQQTGNPGLFNAPTNWTPNGAPIAGNAALFNSWANVLWDSTTGNNACDNLSTGTGSVQFLTNNTPFTFTVGSATLGSGTLVLNHQDLSVTGSTTLDPSGHLMVSTGATFTGSGTFGGAVVLSGGTFNANGNVSLTGALSFASGSNLNVATSTNFTISGGAASFTTGYGLSDGATLSITNGGTIVSSSSVDIGNEVKSSLLVDGSLSSISNATLAQWGFGGGHATITFSNGGVGTYSGGVQIGSGIGASIAQVNLLSSGQVFTTTLAAGGAASSTANININGGTINTSGNVNLGRGATVALTSGGLNVLGSSFTVNPSATFSYAGGTFTTATGGSLTIGGQVILSGGGDKRIKTGSISFTGSGRVDLADNRLIVDYSNPLQSPFTTIKSYLVTGRNGGAWTGNSLTSSTAAAVLADSNNIHKTALGYAEASSLFGAGGGTFDGEQVDGSSVLVRYTFMGDANLDGTVGMTDFNLLASHFGQTGANWSDGDYNYDGIVNALDLNALATNYGQSLSYSSAIALAALIPEPSYVFVVLAPYLLQARVRRKWLSKQLCEENRVF